MERKYERSELYNEILSCLRVQKKEGTTAILNIHIPGTGCRYNSSLPTYDALNAFKYKSQQPAILFFEGTGSEGEDYLSPALNDPDTLEKKQKKTSYAYVPLGSSGRDLDLMAQDDSLASVLGVVGGAGKDTNNKRIIGALKALEEDGALPDVVFLSGHSRGAINCISLSNEIYKHFKNRIKIHMLLTDPVPGPGYGNSQDTKTIPENVVSFTCFYAADEERLFFIAHDHDRLRFESPFTTISSYPVKGTHNSFFKALNDYQPYINNIVCAVNGLLEVNVIDANYFDKSLGGKGYREGSVFHMITPIHPDCPKAVAMSINQLRQDLGDDDLDLDLIQTWQQKKGRFISDIQARVCSQLDFKFEVADTFRMVSNEAKKAIEQEIKGLLEIVSTVLTKTELGILLDKARYEAILEEIAGSLKLNEQGFNVMNGDGVYTSGLTNVYFKNLQQDKGSMVYSGVKSLFGWTTQNNNNDITFVSNQLSEDKESRKKQFFLCVFKSIANRANAKELKVLKEESKILVSHRMRLLRAERPLIGQEISNFIDTKSYQNYCNHLDNLQKDQDLVDNANRFFNAHELDRVDNSVVSDTKLGKK